MRGRPSGLLPLERGVLEVATRFAADGAPSFHGFLAAQALQDSGFQSRLAATGTIYTTLDRLRKAGFLESEWEDVALSESAGRPRRKLYRITAAGRAALLASQREQIGSVTATGLAGADV